MDDDTSLESLPRMQFHLFEPMSISPEMCDFCGRPEQAHPSPEALAEWNRAQEDFNAS